MLGSTSEDIYLLRQKLENFSWFFLSSEVEAVIESRCGLCFPSRQQSKWTLSLQKEPKSLQPTLTSESLVIAFFSLIDPECICTKGRAPHMALTDRYNCDQNISSVGSSSLPAPASASCPKESYTCVFLIIFQAILLIKVRFNFFKKLNR